MDQISNVKLFNQVMDELYTELIDIFPEQTKLKVSYNLFKTICKANVRKPCNEFMIGSIPYLEKIAMKDETFFTSNEKPKILNSINIQNFWTPDLSENTKEAIWRYIKILFKIGITLVEMPCETHDLLKFITT
jgi:hypothetical protein